jgi:Zn-finger nucleic acid-binding protein
LTEDRAARVKGNRTRTVEELKQEVIAESCPDTKKTIHCPRCGREMAKRFLRKPAALYIDVCPKCSHVWFDGGELARAQLSYEISERGRDAAEFQRRVAAMTPEARAEFERNLSKLPEAQEDGSLLSVLIDAAAEGTLGFGEWPS